MCIRDRVWRAKRLHLRSLVPLLPPPAQQHDERTEQDDQGHELPRGGGETVRIRLRQEGEHRPTVARRHLTLGACG